MATVAPGQARPGRGAELALLVFALAMSIYAYAEVGLGVMGRLPGNLGLYSGELCVLALALHILLRWRAPYADPVILPVTVLLNGIGLAMIYRLSLAEPALRGIATRQLLWTAVGVACAAVVIVGVRDHRRLRRLTWTSMVIGLVCLLLPLVPGIGLSAGGAQIWIKVGPLSFQPGEVAKIFLAIFFAGYLVERRDTLALAGRKVLGLRLPRLRDMGPIAVVWAVSLAVLVLQKDLGTSLLFFGLFVAMLYVATDRPSWIVIGLILFAGGVAAAYFLFGHVRARFDIWLDAFNPSYYNRSVGGSAQLVQGLFGLGNGGLFGTGWGGGRPDLTPLAYSDFIVSSLGEELGLTGLMAILMAYLLIVQRGLRTALGVRDGFGKLLAAGLAFTFALQVFTIVGGVTRLIPLTGLVAPFLAAGGSALVANWIVIALLLKVSDGARRPPPKTGELEIRPIQEAVTEAVVRP